MLRFNIIFGSLTLDEKKTKQSVFFGRLDKVEIILAKNLQAFDLRMHYSTRNAVCCMCNVSNARNVVVSTECDAEFRQDWPWALCVLCVAEKWRQSITFVLAFVPCSRISTQWPLADNAQHK